MNYICFYWSYTIFPLSSNDFQVTGWNPPIIHQPFNYGTDAQSCSATCTVALATKTGSLEPCVITIHVLASPLFTFWFCAYRTLQKPHRPPHLGAAMESEYFLLSTSVWEQVVPRGGGNVLVPLKAKDGPWVSGLGATGMFQICSRW